MLPTLNQQSVFSDVMSLYLLECRLVKLDNLPDNQPHQRNDWEAFVDNGRARREILLFATRETSQHTLDETPDSTISRFPAEQYLDASQEQTITMFHKAYSDIIQECEALSEHRLVNKLQLAQSFIPGDSVIGERVPPVTPITKIA